VELSMTNSGGPDWIGVDLDKTLAVRRKGDPIDVIGPPITSMVERVKKWVAEGKRVKIFTARVSSLHDDAIVQRRLIEVWCHLVIGTTLEVTAEKDRFMVALYDDLAHGVEANTGRIKCSCPGHDA